MRPLIMFLSILCLPASAQAYIVEGRISSLDDRLRPTVYLARISDIQDFQATSQRFIIDSTIIDEEGNFRIEGQHLLQKNSLFDVQDEKSISWGGQKEAVCRLYMVPRGSPASSITGDKVYSIYLVLKEDSRIKLQFDSGNFDAYELIQSNKGSGELRKLRQHIVKPIYDQMDSMKIAIAEAGQSNNINEDSLNALQEDMLRKLANTYRTIQPELRSSLMAFESIGAQMFAAMVHVDYNSSLHDDLPFFRKLEARLKSKCVDCRYVQQFQDHLQDAYSLKPGTPAPGFHEEEYYFVDTNGIKQELGAWKGKVVLLDFWASWCSPCRKAIRDKLPSMYEKYGEANFDIIGISREKDINAWKKALKQDQVSWTSLYQSPKSEPSISDAYSVRSLPHYALIDKKGQIVLAGGLLTNIEAQLERMLVVENNTDTIQLRLLPGTSRNELKSKLNRLRTFGLEVELIPKYKGGKLKGLKGSIKDAESSLSVTVPARLEQVKIIIYKQNRSYKLGAVYAEQESIFGF